MSTAAVSCLWFCRNERQVGEGALERHGRYLPTVAWLTSKPSLSSSPWMRGAPQRGFARLILRDSSPDPAAHPGPPQTASSAPPVEAEATTMPLDDGCRFYS